MIIVRKNSTNNQFFFKEKKGFFGRLWDAITENLGAILGFLVGGPVGAGVGIFIQNLLTMNQETEEASTGKFNVNVDAVNEDSYPISSTEENILFKWLDFQFKPTIIKIANSVDQSIQLVFSKVSKTSNTEILAINKALKDLSILKAYALHIQQFGEYQTGYFSSIKLSDNFIINKVEAIFIVLDQVEKSILKYMVDNNYSDYKLIAQSEDISNISTVEKVIIDWQGQKVIANIKQYKEASLVDDSQVIDVINTDLNNTNPATSTDTEVINAEGEAKPTNNKLLKAAGVTTAIVLIGKALKNKKKTK